MGFYDLRPDDIKPFTCPFHVRIKKDIWGQHVGEKLTKNKNTTNKPNNLQTSLIISSQS